MFPDDFSHLGTSEAIRKALQRLREKGLIKQVAHGIYVRPKINDLIGELTPSAEEVAKGEISTLVIQALREIGKDYVTEEKKDKILELLKKEKPYKLQHDIQLAPVWIRTIMKQALNN